MGTFTVTSTVGGNQKPTIGNYNLLLGNRENKALLGAMFTTDTNPPYSDPESDPPLLVKILTLPNIGTLQYNGTSVTINQEITVADLNTGSLIWVAPDSDTLSSVSFQFDISDGQYTETPATFTITNRRLTVPTNHPPIVGNGTGVLSENVYPFKLYDFITGFIDFDGDSYEKVQIKTLPTIGVIEYDDVPVPVDFEFNIDDIILLKYNFPNNYIITKNTYCEFEEPVINIITTYANDGYTLESKKEGYLKFVKDIPSSLPNDTDIYAFFDATSMKIADANSARQALITWYDEFKLNNPLYTGQLYILPIIMENWVGFPTLIVRGSAAAVGNNSDRPLDDFMEYAIIPNNFDIETNDINLAWTAPESVLVLAFIDEVDQGSAIPAQSAAYHRNRNGYGFDQQPSAQYLTDYKLFMEALPNFTFFKGIFYPIPDIDAGNFNNPYNACVLQGFAAIEGGPAYTLQEIENLGVTYANERRFHWHLDPNHPYYSGSGPIANPYSKEAQTPVPGTTYNLQGLKDFGWIGVYDKDQPASTVFFTQTFANDLNKYLVGQVTTTQDIQIVQGNCIPKYDICFDFRTSDNSTGKLYSNIATFCFTDDSKFATAPTVDSSSDKLLLRVHTFGTNNFTKNFTDVDGDSYSTISIKSLPQYGILKLLGQPITTGANFLAVNSGALTYTLDSRYAVYNNLLYDFEEPIEDIIDTYANLGYSLIQNGDGKMVFSDNNSQIIVPGKIMTGKIQFSFTAKDDSVYAKESNIATFTLLPEGNIVTGQATANKPPNIVGDNSHLTTYTRPIIFKQSDFIEDTDPRFSDPENDEPYQLKILSLPLTGELRFDSQAVTVNQIINFSDIRAGLFSYIPDPLRKDITTVSFRRAVSDIGSKIFVE